MPMPRSVRIIRPASRETEDFLGQRIKSLKLLGFSVSFNDIPSYPDWPCVAGSTLDRSTALNAALTGSDDIIWCARGGYGVSDVVEFIPWESLATKKPKWVIGFSDICVLHSALFTRLKWTTLIHGPMPATKLWPESDRAEDLAATLSIVKGEPTTVSIALRAVAPPTPAQISQPIQGWLFGGNLSSLSQLIGTPYFPKSLSGAILFLEDLTEPRGRLMRQFMQWHLSGALQGVRAIVLGSFTRLGKDIPDDDPAFCAELARRVTMPVYKTEQFGHIGLNKPLGIGRMAKIIGQALVWKNTTNPEATPIA